MRPGPDGQGHAEQEEPGHPRDPGEDEAGAQGRRPPAGSDQEADRGTAGSLRGQGCRVAAAQGQVVEQLRVLEVGDADGSVEGAEDPCQQPPVDPLDGPVGHELPRRVDELLGGEEADEHGQAGEGPVRRRPGPSLPHGVGDVADQRPGGQRRGRGDDRADHDRRDQGRRAAAVRPVEAAAASPSAAGAARAPRPSGRRPRPASPPRHRRTAVCIRADACCPDQAVVASRCCSRSWAASSMSLCRHSAARYWQAMRPERWRRRKSP